MTTAMLDRYHALALERLRSDGMEAHIDGATIGRYRAHGQATLRLVANLPPSHDPLRKRASLLRSARWAFTSASRIVLVNLAQQAERDAHRGDGDELQLAENRRRRDDARLNPASGD